MQTVAPLHETTTPAIEWVFAPVSVSLFGSDELVRWPRYLQHSPLGIPTMYAFQIEAARSIESTPVEGFVRRIGKSTCFCMGGIPMTFIQDF